MILRQKAKQGETSTSTIISDSIKRWAFLIAYDPNISSLPLA